MKGAWGHLRTAVSLLLLLMLLTGLLYPFAVTAIAQWLFPWHANGSLVSVQGIKRGSVLIGQSFSSPGYFWGRPSVTDPFPYNASASAGANQGPTNFKFLATVKARVQVLKMADSGNHQAVPVDLVTASGSGLDPEISPQAAFYQIPRVAKARGMSVAALHALIEAHLKKRTFNVLGEPRVNVLLLNLALDNLTVDHVSW